VSRDVELQPAPFLEPARESEDPRRFDTLASRLPEQLTLVSHSLTHSTILLEFSPPATRAGNAVRPRGRPGVQVVVPELPAWSNQLTEPSKLG